MAGITVVTEPARLPLEVRDVKNFLKLDEDSDEVIVRTLIGVARDFVEEYIGRSLINRTLKLMLDGISEVEVDLWEGTREGPDITFRARSIELHYGPLQSVTHVKTYDDNDAATTLDSAKYFVDTTHMPGRIVLRNGENWPSSLRVASSVEVQYVAGYGASPANIPEPIRLAMYQYITYMYENRGDEGSMPPASIGQLLQPYKVMNLTSKPFSGRERV